MKTTKEGMRLVKWLVVSSVATSLVLGATFTYAQQEDIEQSARLRTQIRSAIMADARSVELSGVEIDAMVEKLAGEAENQGVSEDIAPPPPPPPPETFGAAEESGGVMTPWGQDVPMAALYGVVLASLLVAFFLLKWIISMRHRHEGQSMDATVQPPQSPPPAAQ